MCGEDAATDRTCQKCFVKFRVGDFLLDDVPWSSRSVEVTGNKDQIETLMENSRCYAMQDIADILKISTPSIENHLHQLGYVNLFDVWAPHTVLFGL